MSSSEASSHLQCYLMTHLRSKLQTLVVQVFLLPDQLEAHHVVGVDHVLLQRAVLESWLCHRFQSSASAA